MQSTLQKEPGRYLACSRADSHRRDIHRCNQYWSNAIVVTRRSLSGITEIRPGTYIFMDAAQGHAIQDYSRCAATVLATVTSKPTSDRVVVDAGGKALTSFVRTKGICITPGYGRVEGFDDLRLAKLYDEHGIILDSAASKKLRLGDKIQIIPNHICPTCSLYDTMYILDGENVVDEYPILCRGKSQ